MSNTTIDATTFEGDWNTPDQSNWDLGSNLPSFDGAEDIGDGNYALSDGSFISLSSDGDVGYSTVLFDSFADLDAFMGGGSVDIFKNGTSPNAGESTVSSILKKLDENSTLSKFLVEGGAGLLKNLGQQEMLKEQREWLEKEKQKDWDRKMDSRKFGQVKPAQQTGLLASVQKRQGVNNGTA